MPFQRPSLSELREQSRSAIRSRLGLGPLMPRSVLQVIADAFSGAVHHVYGYIGWIFKQAFTDTVEADGLDRDASLWNITRLAATFASGNLTINAVVGTAIPAGSQWKRVDGVVVELDGLGIITLLPSEDVPVVAVAAGSSGNCESGTQFSSSTPISGLTSDATASGDIAGGSDQETDSALRARVLVRRRLSPQGGAEADYVLWATTIADVTRAWVTSGVSGAGGVLVHIATDDVSGGPIPSAAKVAEVQSYIDGVRPLTAKPFVEAPVAAALDPEIVLVPDTPSTRATVEQSLNDYLRRSAEPGATLYISQIREAISIAAGETNHTLILPAADVVSAGNELAVLGTVTWS